MICFPFFCSGRQPYSLRSVSNLLEISGWKTTAMFIPAFISIPLCMLHMAGNKFWEDRNDYSPSSILTKTITNQVFYWVLFSFYLSLEFSVPKFNGLNRVKTYRLAAYVIVIMLYNWFSVVLHWVIKASRMLNPLQLVKNQHCSIQQLSVGCFWYYFTSDVGTKRWSV